MDASLYRWTIKTSEDLYSGTSPGQVYLSLHGLDAAMKETRISQTKALGQFAKGSQDSGMLSVAENLGALQTGTLRCTGRWKVDWVNVKSLDEKDGRTWQADVGRWDQEGKFPILRFEQIATDVADTDETEKSDSEDADPETTVETGTREQAQKQPMDDPEITALQRKLDQLNRDLEVLRLRKAVAEKQKEFDASASDSEPESAAPEPGAADENPPAGDQTPDSMTTFEVIARVSGIKVPFTEAVLMLDGTPIVLPGAALFVGSTASDGFGLGGAPGRWREYYPNTPPESLGLPQGVGVLVYDGSRGHALDPATLQRLLGPSWRSQFTQ